MGNIWASACLARRDLRLGRLWASVSLVSTGSTQNQPGRLMSLFMTLLYLFIYFLLLSCYYDIITAMYSTCVLPHTWTCANSLILISSKKKKIKARRLLNMCINNGEEHIMQVGI
jgi:hypothetical protein